MESTSLRCKASSTESKSSVGYYEWSLKRASITLISSTAAAVSGGHERTPNRHNSLIWIQRTRRGRAYCFPCAAFGSECVGNIHSSSKRVARSRTVVGQRSSSASGRTPRSGHPASPACLDALRCQEHRDRPRSSTAVPGAAFNFVA